MDKINPVVITSKPAVDHLNKIKLEHSDIINNIQNQALKVQQYNIQKEAKLAEKATQDATIAKDQAETERKNKELSIKEQALTL